MLHSVKTDSDFQGLLTASQTRPVFLFKHSSTCPISAAAWAEFQAFLKGRSDDHWMNLVIEDRPVARAIAASTGVTHQSPQAILFHGGRPVWNASHGDIHLDSLNEAIASVASKS